ncbi:hypothetical protein DFH06DRAFT_955897, partial [Mycena polygramma]
DISRRVAQRQLEAALKAATYPGISTLPPEIMSRIFSYCISPLASSECSAPPMLLLHVCRKWRAIAATTPSLWTTFEINVENFSSDLLEGLEGYIGRWLGRARSLPTSIALTGKITSRLGYPRIR